ncbi:LacI family DNA-binding transcriptional regulator [Couchioplanes caeruleus]|uniref:LacI family transcriptional regulator n=2 Tax=Couchioplanes caeruleus TaxID=56438 RepID=A0A1K0FAE4_9ACTN|nr:LacI family DNA-binding transcriptional regulator [Couchioplanes caeruleus]OJF09712.1 LacI family transcriptional regulator [Couchioplanes caeruleus subsp. caeruleus]ROP30505.1 LacI family transcriptional regulator [Couchioplanes caeruleus]
MKHPYRIREIAAQSGLSQATVDRVLHRRGGVRASTVREVEQAIADLDRQQSQLRIGGRTFMVDVVVQAPARFSTSVRHALEAELPAMRPAVIRSRFHFLDSAGAGELVALLEKVGRTKSHGVILKAPDVPEIIAAVARLSRQGIPVVTLVTDLPTSARAAYVGIDNRAAGATAAYLVQEWLADRAGDVLVVRGHGSFRGEDEREMGFRAEMRTGGASRRLLEVVDEEDRADAVHIGTREVLAANPSVRAVYSLYAGAGGNAAVIDAFDREKWHYDVFVAHDLDGENTVLLRERRLSAVLHHDLRQDLRRACHVVMQAQGALPGPVRSTPSAIQVITPHNAPPAEL